MPSRFSRYLMKLGTILGPDYFNSIFQDLDDRLVPLEDKRAGEEAVYLQIEDRVLERSESVIQELRGRLVKITNLDWLVAFSDTVAILNEGTAVSLVILPEQRALFAPGPFSVISRASTPNDYAIVRTVGYDRILGQYDFIVISSHGDIGPHNDWVLAAIAGSTLAQMQMLDETRTIKADVDVAQEAAAVSKIQAAMSSSIAQAAAAQINTRLIVSTASPTGGSDGDIWFKI